MLQVQKYQFQGNTCKSPIIRCIEKNWKKNIKILGMVFIISYLFFFIFWTV